MTTTKKTKPAPEPVVEMLTADPAPELVFPVDPAPAPAPTPVEAAPAEEPKVPQFISVIAVVPTAKEVSTMEESLMAVLAPLGLSERTMEVLADQGMTTLDAFDGISKADLTGIGIKLGDANKIANAVTAATVSAEPIPMAATPMAAGFSLLPAPPDDTSFLEMLKVGGILKIEPVDVIAAMRAAIASGVGLYDLPERVLSEMERVAETLEEPVSDGFYRLQKLVTSRSYAEVLGALGVPGTFVSDKRKREVLRRLDMHLWPALRTFNDQLIGWSDAWGRGFSNPGLALTALAMAQSGQPSIMPPGMMQPPATDGLRDAAEGFINQVNRVFSGTGIPVARALAYDAVRIREVLNDTALPAALGVSNREQMLKMLGVSVGADIVRLERNVIQFALGAMELPRVSAGNEELAYLSQLISLGAVIPWDQLGGAITTKEPRRTSGGGFRDNTSGSGVRV